ncbi:YcjX family protein [Halomonas piscis]|uniref:YcjX family protein n=1 Tax=Halomonas piscis TaxID=3031727 RepID=A0ABY9YX75_9GAMM|nr:YcjX family protein [Halomonas piscis]WNK19411.1 YcjX family protein [Halomonas piscis]
MAALHDTLGRELGNLLERGRDRQLRLAVTGLSQAGKTAFLTSLVNQLRHAGVEARLDLLPAARDGRLLGARRLNQPDLGVPRFPYDPAMQALRDTPPRWPDPTRGISELRLELRYRPARSGWLRGAASHLTLDLFDYPGEWLLDLPLLDQDYYQWCQTRPFDQGEQRREVFAEWLAAAEALDPAAEADEAVLAELAEAYAQGLRRAKQLGFSQLQPGRFLLPGELEGAPVLQFFPLPHLSKPREELEALPDSSVYATLATRFRYYQKQVVQPFYREHFRRFDRQIVLVDVLGALNAGPERFEDLSRALGELMQSFSYGKRSLLRRLFTPRIDRLAIAATKADHVTPDQHDNLVTLLNSLLKEPLKDLRFADVPVKALSLAAIRTTWPREVNQGKTRLPALRGTTLEGEDVLVYPGDVPAALPDAAFWQRQGFDFPRFRPMPEVSGALPHIRMDAAIDWLIGDKLT